MFSDFILNDQRNGSHVYIYDDQGNLFAYSRYSGEHFGNREETENQLAAYANRVLTGGEVVLETNWRKVDGVLVGVPIEDNLERVCGAVLVTKPANQLRASMMTMTLTLLMSSIAAIVTLLTKKKRQIK